MNEPRDDARSAANDDADRVRGWGNVALMLGMVLVPFLFVANDFRVPPEALMATPAFAVVGVGLRIEAAIRENRR
ncbi:hypothetical protein ACLQ2R_36185 [Streptosporangium sp. DT93]|uniref:hypothetical protein n=1 Tax=Streptosporangium sp. DT93 TaxID=3393428 RepID=UPI003CF1C090